MSIMSMTIKVAAVQMTPQLAQVRENLATLVRNAQQAAAGGARLVVFPEAALTGYCFRNREEAFPLAESVPGPSTAQLTTVCRREGIWIVVGLLERAGEHLYNTAVLIGPEGVCGHYRKLHLPCLGVDRFATPGDFPLQIYTTPIGRIGLNICYDAAFPEVARVLMLQGADLVVLPTNWPAQAFKMPRYVVPARAIENSVHYIACDRVGTERGWTFLGRSTIVSCRGDVLAEGSDDREEILYAELDMMAPRQKRHVIIPGEYELDRVADRRPQYYQLMVSEVSAVPSGEGSNDVASNQNCRHARTGLC